MDRKVELIPGRNNLMVVAHPDDETIFGFAQLALAASSWTVLCITNGDHPVRRQEFAEVSQELGIRSHIWTFRDSRWDSFPNLDQQQIALRLQDYCEREKVDNVLTHGAAGEYGHSQHQALHHIVCTTFIEAGFAGIYTFARHKHPLPPHLLEWKLRTIALYKAQNILPQHRSFVEYEGWEFLPSPEPQTDATLTRQI